MEAEGVWGKLFTTAGISLGLASGSASTHYHFGFTGSLATRADFGFFSLDSWLRCWASRLTSLHRASVWLAGASAELGKGRRPGSFLLSTRHWFLGRWCWRSLSGGDCQRCCGAPAGALPYAGAARRATRRPPGLRLRAAFGASVARPRSPRAATGRDRRRGVWRRFEGLRPGLTPSPPSWRKPLAGRSPCASVGEAEPGFSKARGEAA